LGIEEIYPGHSKPFKVEKAMEEFGEVEKEDSVVEKGRPFSFSLPFFNYFE
jgi:hypothetical protein